MRGNIQSAAAHTHTHMSVHIIKHRMHTGHSTHWNWSECPRARRTRMYRMMVRRWIWIRCASITQYFAHVDLCCGNVRIVPTHTPMQLFRHIFFFLSLFFCWPFLVIKVSKQKFIGLETLAMEMARRLHHFELCDFIFVHFLLFDK